MGSFRSALKAIVSTPYRAVVSIQLPTSSP
jgi:hypothetical protein